MAEPSSEAKQVAQINGIYQALGKFVVEFSTLVSQMEGCISIVNGIGGGERTQKLLHAVLVELTADPLARAWRSTMIQAIDLTSDDIDVLTGLVAEIGTLITLRNDWSHGGWFVGYGPDGSSTAKLMRFKNSARGTTPPSGLEGFPTSDYIEKAATHVAFVANAVFTYGLIVAGISAEELQGVRPSDHVRVAKLGGGRRRIQILELKMAGNDDAWRFSEWP